MDLVSSFVYLIQPLAVVMTAPTFNNFVFVLSGWTFARRRTVTGILVAGGLAGKRHHSAFHRVFATARWSLDALGLAVFRLIEPLVPEGVIYIAVDDTLARKRGTKIFGVGMHHDPLLSSRGKQITNWGLNFVVLGVIVRFPVWPDRPFCLPILFRLYLNQKAADKARRVRRTRPELAIEMLKVLCAFRKNRHFHAITDSTYGGQSVLAYLPNNCDLTSRLTIDARLYTEPPQLQAGQKGRPRKRGTRLPSPAEMLQARSQHLDLEVYGRHQRVRMAECTACLHMVPNRLVRVVAIEPLNGGRKCEVFYATCYQTNAIVILQNYSMRWSIEVAFHDSKVHLGFEEPQGWTRSAVERTAPVAMLLYTLIVVWFIQDGDHKYRPAIRPWYRKKRRASFTDMLATLRRESIRERIIRWGLTGPGSRKILHALENTLALAA
jgi:hypothetical protein